ncbi:MAG: hypothetical protein K8R74_12215 [Bacteroidales bacterium]|nr:hypothetical protein [Bacteroidales bacterium]
MLKQELLKALELDTEGDWDASHRIVQQYFSAEAYWIHAYLHRKEGDLGNAGYWYARANKNIPEQSLEEEWKVIHEYVCNL